MTMPLLPPPWQQSAHSRALCYHPDWLTPSEADHLLEYLDTRLNWQRPSITLYGKQHLIPRSQVWMGDSDAHYRYSNTLFKPTPWDSLLLSIRERLSSTLALLGDTLNWPDQISKNGKSNREFNSVLLNRYADGGQTMGWHSDDEPELGPTPIIASISLGASRDMRFRPRAIGKAASSSSQTRDKEQAFNLTLGHGSLLIMGPCIQHQFQHAIPARRQAGMRINLTFRTIVTTPGN